MMPALQIDTVRSALFTPATRIAAAIKAMAAGADMTILDLEDGTAPGAKAEARDAAAGFAADPPATRPRGPSWMLRINHVTTEAGLLDLLALRSWSRRPALVMLPKTESPAEVHIAASHLGPETRFVALVETAKGLDAAARIASMGQVAALAFGGADLAADLGADLAWEPMLMARARLVQAAATGGIPAWDMPFLTIGDESGLTHEAQAAQAMGFAAKMAVHPAQIAPINRVFTPGAARVDAAARILAAHEAAGGGACALDGRMIDLPVVRAARRTLSRAALAAPIGGTA